MRPISERSRYSAIATKISPILHHLRPFSQASKSLAVLALTVTPLYAQAALPEAIQAALARANLTEADISMVITPVGDKNDSHLPTPIQVIDSSQQAVANSAQNHTDDSQPNAQKDNHQNSNKNNSNSITQQSALVTIERRTIEQHEKKIHAYTDDAYTYQSVESIPDVLDDQPKAAINPHESRDANGKNTNTGSTHISFSPLISHQPNTARTPASTMKLVPSFIALDTLGADFVWLTRVYHTGIIVGDRLYGDLVIQGSGDPKMTHERLHQLLYHVKQAGIKHIDGNIIVDTAIFEQVAKDPAAFDNAPLRPYNASPDGFLVNFSSIGIKSQPLNNGQAQLTYTPQLANYQLPSVVDTRTGACASANYSLNPQWQTNRLQINSELPSSCGEHVFYIAYPDAKDFAARVLADKWHALGNTLSGQVISQERPYSTLINTHKAGSLAALPLSPLPIVSYPSLTLAQQIYDINHFSNNVMAEQVALSIGAYHATSVAANATSQVTAASQATATNVGTPVTIQGATSLYNFGSPHHTNYPATLQTINEWWQTHLKTPPPHLTNGSGLCRTCTISAANLSELLSYAYDSPSFGVYVDSLGVAGVNGTIATHGERLPDSAAIGRAWIKTGTLNNVTSMAGYVKGQSGQDYTVVGLINTDQALNIYAARTVLDAMLDWTAQH
ncbi:MAG: D-alanyl-D-alanine carboxypeptidase/D-alanyl-D-alanine-endopeptidase [Psychrobacter sp.]|uniref:D-alanyl-D-alanine carboxypeptidase/D-alanyl-D-alanine-endopeptidase n=1 Tax=Psychrobacter sp. AOP7-B1-24 TaxID=3457645 RepID=UPI003FB6D9E2